MEPKTGVERMVGAAPGRSASSAWPPVEFANMNATTPNHESPWPPLFNWDWWPLARLLVVLAAAGLAASRLLGWHVDLHPLLTLPGRVAGVAVFLAILSFSLAELYLGAFLCVFLFPLYVLVQLNDAFYRASRRALRMALPSQSPRLVALWALAGELLLFAATAWLLRHAAARVPL